LNGHYDDADGMLTCVCVCLCAAAVTRCDPEIECRQQLEAALLQKSRDFGGFVRAMRQQFRQIAAAEQ
jgi:hypothetical protein